MPADRPRERWMDLLRGAAILLVVFLHTLGPLDDHGRTPPSGLLTINGAVAPFRIPTLVFLSGMLLHGSLRKGPERFASGKLSRIGWPYLLWSGVLLVVVGNVSTHTVVAVFYDPPTYLWYLFFLLIYYFLAYALTLAPSIPALAVTAASLVLSGFMPEDGRSQRFFFLLAFFLAGDWAARHPQIWRPWVDRNGVVVAGAGLALVGAVLSANDTLVRYQPEYVWAVLGLLVVALRCAPALSGHALSAPLELVGRESLVFYVVHLPAILTAAKLLRSAGLDGPGVLVPAGFVAALGTGYAFVVAQRRMPRVGWLFAFPIRTPVRAGSR